MSAPNIDSAYEADTEELLRRLGPFVLRSNLITAARFVLIGCAGWIGFILFVMVVDFVSETPADVRWFCGRGSAIASLIAVSVLSYLSFRKNSTGILAFRIDEAEATGGQITTGWDLLRRMDEYDSPLTAHFAKQAIHQSIEILSAIEPAAVLPLQSLKRPASAVAVLIFMMALIALISPPLAWTQFKRIAFPASDTPPFTGVEIALDKTKHSLRYGEDVKIIATVSRKLRERLELVTISKDGKERLLPMLPRGETRWQALLTEVKEPVQFFARAGRSHSETGELDVQITPKILESIVRITPLEYTRQAIYEGKIPDSGISGLANTMVEIFVTSNRPLKAGKMQIHCDNRNERSVDLVIQSAETSQANTVSCSFLLDRDACFEITVTDVDGLQSIEPVRGKIEILVDQRPIVRILEPKQFSLATPDIDLPVSILAEDDFGITQLRLYRSLNGSLAESIDLPFQESARANGVLPLPLKRFDLVPGDEIELFARTEDNDPNGPKSAESPKTTIRIISVAEFQERMLEQRGAEALAAKFEAAQRQLENVSTALADARVAAERSAVDANNESLQLELEQKLRATEKAAESAAQEIDRFAKNPSEIDIDQELSKMLKELAAETTKTAKQLNQMARSQDGQQPLNESEQELLNELREKTKLNRQQLQAEAIDPLNELSRTLPALQDKESFDELVDRQKELAQGMQSLADAGPNDPSNERRMMEMEAAQEELRQELNELAESIAENAEQLPVSEEFSSLRQSAQQLAEGIKLSGAPELMEKAQKFLLKSKFQQAAENALAAADSMDALIPENNSMGNDAGKSLQEAFQKPGRERASQLGRTLEQLKKRLNQGDRKPGDGQGGSHPVEPDGVNNAFSNSSPRQPNIGMYGSMPTPSTTTRGRSDKDNQGTATQSEIARQGKGRSNSSESQPSDASSQSQQDIPAQYRQRVSDYYRRIQSGLTPQ